MNSLDQTILNVVLPALAEACRVTRSVQLADRVERETKSDLSPVTVADYAAQAIIAHHLRDTYGAIALVGEEDARSLREPSNRTLRDSVVAAVQSVWPAATHDAVLDSIDLGNHDASADCYWTLDPVDGTKGFLRGGQYAISLARIEHGTVTFGALGCPNLSADFSRAFDQPDAYGSIFYAATGAGSW